MNRSLMLLRLGRTSITFTKTIRFNATILQKIPIKPVQLIKATEIISLNNQQINQLASITHYTSSIQYLQQNDLDKSLAYLQFALTEALNKFPYSINLQLCLMNRISILYKLLNHNFKFVQILEEIYFMTLSSKSNNALDTIKALKNYLTALLINNRPKACSVIDFIKESDKNTKNIVFFDGVIDIIDRNLEEEGLKKLKSLPESTTAQKFFKLNNVGWMKALSLKNKYTNDKQLKAALTKDHEQILTYYLKALLEAENTPEEGMVYSNDKNISNQYTHFIKSIEKYLERTDSSLQKFEPKQLLRNSQSHIIAMNIAYLLFEVDRLQECYFYLQVALQKAVSLNELERIGLALVLMSRYHYQQRIESWQEIMLSILQNSGKYTKSILKESLLAYSKILFAEGRLVEAESYYNQSLKIQQNCELEGLILPPYDFSF